MWVALLDEFWTAIPVVAAPALESSLGLDHDGYAFWVLSVPTLVAGLLEAPLLVQSDRWSRLFVLRWGVRVLALGLAICALARLPEVLSLGLVVSGVATGVISATAQGELVMSSLGPDRAMARWTTLSSVGDLSGPFFVAAILALGGDYHVSFLVLSCALLVLSLTIKTPTSNGHDAKRATEASSLHANTLSTSLASQNEDEEEKEDPQTGDLQTEDLGEDEDQSPPGIFEISLPPRLWLLLAAAACCVLLDETAAALLALRVTQDLGRDSELASLLIGLFAAGGLLGAMLQEWLLPRIGRKTLLASSCILSLGAIVGAARGDDLLVLGASLILLGSSVAPHYALLISEAHRLLPGRPGLLGAAAALLLPVELLLPWCAGGVAERYGLTVGFLFLSLQPVCVGFCLFLLPPVRDPRDGG